MVHLDFGPEQHPLTQERIAEILEWRPRRMVLGGPEWPSVLKPPSAKGKDWSIVVPFCETLKNAFKHGCNFPSIGMRPAGERCYTFLKGSAALELEDLSEVTDWIGTVGRFVAIRDGLCLSFALDFDRQNGNPELGQTDVGRLRVRAKPYGGRQTPDGYRASDELVTLLNDFLNVMASYRVADSIVAVPPSDPLKPFDLPAYLVGKLAALRGLENLSDSLRSGASRPQMKDMPKEKKVQTLLGTLVADKAKFEKRSVLLVDDLYQSGASANVAAMEILGSGAKRVLGLFCEKTCRNDDNVS